MEDWTPEAVGKNVAIFLFVIRGITVGHLPRKYSRIAWYFLARGGSITLEVTGRRRHCKQLCGGMEIPCCVTGFSCSRKATINRLKDLLTKKV